MPLFWTGEKQDHLVVLVDGVGNRKTVIAPIPDCPEILVPVPLPVTAPGEQRRRVSWEDVLARHRFVRTLDTDRDGLRVYRLVGPPRALPPIRYIERFNPLDPVDHALQEIIGGREMSAWLDKLRDLRDFFNHDNLRTALDITDEHEE
jgi:hypothetical protein